MCKMRLRLKCKNSQNSQNETETEVVYTCARTVQCDVTDSRRKIQSDPGYFIVLAQQCLASQPPLKVRCSCVTSQHRSVYFQRLLIHLSQSRFVALLWRRVSCIYMRLFQFFQVLQMFFLMKTKYGSVLRALYRPYYLRQSKNDCSIKLQIQFYIHISF